MDTLDRHKILVVEDEREIRDLVSLILLRAGYTLRAVESAEQARECLKTEFYDVIILDWMLPAESGVDLLSDIRKNEGEMRSSILLMTARAEPEDIVVGLDRGADDYVTKPFDGRVLVARITALLRRAKSSEPEQVEQLSYGDLFIDHVKMEVLLGGKEVDLTTTEFRLLWALVSNPHVVLTRDRILSLIQGTEVNVIGRTVDTHMFALRKKIAPWSDCILTVRGVGYRFTPN